MFGDKTIVVKGGSHTHTHNHKITEQKAPTDESMRLLDEFKKEATDTVVARGMLRCEDIKAEIAYMIIQEDFLDLTVRYRFIMNGKEFNGDFRITDSDTGTIEFAELLSAKVLKHMTLKLSFELVKTQQYQKNSLVGLK